MIRLSGFEQMHSLARIDYDYAVLVFDCPRIRWQPVCPHRIGVNCELPRNRAMSAPFDLRALNFDEAGLNCMDAHCDLQQLQCGT
jgi:hypothetical protein